MHSLTHYGTFLHSFCIVLHIFLKPIILTQEPQKYRNSSKSLIRKFSPLQSFLFEKAKTKKKNMEKSKFWFFVARFGYLWELGPFSERPSNSLSILFLLAWSNNIKLVKKIKTNIMISSFLWCICSLSYFSQPNFSKALALIAWALLPISVST